METFPASQADSVLVPVEALMDAPDAPRESWYLHHRHAEYLRQQVAAGGLLLSARTSPRVLEARATEILIRHGATHVHVHGEALA